MTPLGIFWAIIALGILIFVHELGHFLFAKLFKVGVEKFSLGFGPKLFGKRFGETEYLISVFPLGGYVKMVGEGEEGELPPEKKPQSFLGKPPYQRIFIVAAGPVFNLIFAFFIFIVIFIIGIPALAPRIGKVLENKPAARAGLKPNDLVVSLNGKAISTFEEMQQEVLGGKGKPVDIRVRRDGRDLDFHIVPEIITEKNILGQTDKFSIIGVESTAEKITKRFSPRESISLGAKRTLDLIRLTYVILGKLVQRAIPLDTIGGPIMIAKMAGEQAAEGGVNFLGLLALLSINLGVLNLLPIPILDGGHIFFNLWELIFRKPVSLKAREVAQQVGLALLLGLMFLAFYNDIVRYFIKQG